MQADAGGHAILLTAFQEAGETDFMGTREFHGTLRQASRFHHMNLFMDPDILT